MVLSFIAFEPLSWVSIIFCEFFDNVWTSVTEFFLKIIKIAYASIVLIHEHNNPTYII